MIVHELKAWPTYFRPTWDGEKLFDVRFDDHGFQRGDLVNLREWDASRHCKCKTPGHTAKCERYTGRRIIAEVGYVLGSTPGRGSRPGFAGAGYVVLSLMNLDRVDGARTTEISEDAAAAIAGLMEADAAQMRGEIPEQRQPPP